MLIPRPTKNIDGTHPIASPTYRMALLRWLDICDIRDEHDLPMQLTPHQWRHTLVICTASDRMRYVDSAASLRTPRRNSHGPCPTG